MKYLMRPFKREEVKLYSDWMSDPEITGPYVRQDTKTLVELLENFDESGWQSPDFKRWIFTNTEGEVFGVGQAWKYDLYETHVEVGRVLLPNCRGKGLGTLLMTTLFDEIFKDQSIHRIQAITVVENIATVKTWQKAGMKVEGTLREFLTVEDKRFDCYIGSILRREWNIQSK